MDAAETYIMKTLLKLLYFSGITFLTIVFSYGISLVYGFESVMFAGNFNLILMAWAAIVLKSVNWQLKWKYFLPKPVESNGTVYKWHGVLWFNWFLNISGWNRIIMKEINFTQSKEGLIRLELHTRYGEFSHLLIFLIIFVVSIPILMGGNIEIFLWFLGFNVFFNMYPVILQRYKRIRVLKILNAKRIDPYAKV